MLSFSVLSVMSLPHRVTPSNILMCAPSAISILHKNTIREACTASSRRRIRYFPCWITGTAEACDVDSRAKRASRQYAVGISPWFYMTMAPSSMSCLIILDKLGMDIHFLLLAAFSCRISFPLYQVQQLFSYSAL
ncbi:hypothetical protein B0T17DRAFT_295743 [Bombardia bombarda]|uniref:Uncharacterized protein n=1 Tax=Bombardia bombarda TaxID=252184 RepID=A0AA40C1R2_9PEZI|nr:hypothetical protein B0T17DRAFT_295743 [Bombardia bombarda]